MKCPECQRQIPDSSSRCSACGAYIHPSTVHTKSRATEPILHLEPGQTFGKRFTVVEEVGVGGMGFVYKAVDREGHHAVALKLLRSDIAARRVGLERFKRELALAQQVSHPNVCRVHDMGEEDGVRFITMEFVQGQSLEDLIHSVGSLSPRQAVTLAKQICDGLEAIHGRSIVHRDLKPSNIMIDRSGRAVVMDFGLATQSGTEKLTDEGQVLGTLAYISPEQATGRKVDKRSDIYALGLLLFEMLTGKRPPGDTGRAPMALRSGEICPPPSRFNTDIHRELDAVVLKCLEHDPQNRFQSVAEVSDALSGIETLASLPSGSERKRPTRRRSYWTAGVATAVLALAMILVFLRVQPPEQATGLAVLPLAYYGPSEQDYLRNLIPFLVGDELSGATDIEVVPFDTSRNFGSEDNPASVARQLSVAHVLHGSIRVEQGRFNLQMRLWGSGGDTAWSRESSGEVSDFLASMEPVVGDLVVALGSRADSALAMMRTRKPGALDAYVAGLSYLDGWDIEKNYLRAEELFRQALEKDDEFPEAYSGLSLAIWRRYRETGEAHLVEEAKEAAERSVSLNPSLPEGQLALGVVLLGMGRSAEAASTLERAQDLAPENDAICRWISQAYDALDRDQDAERMLQRAIELRPNYWGNYNRKGIFHLRRGQFDRAKEAFRNVIEVSPESPTGYNNLASAHMMAGELDQAEPLLLAAARIEPTGDIYDNLGFICYSTDRLEKAAEHFAQAVELRPEEPLSWGNLGDAYRQLGESEKAEEAYNRAIELTEAQLEVDPDNGDTRLAYAMYLAGLWRCVEAEAQIARALESGTDIPERHYYAALAYAVCGDGAEVIEHLRLALEGGFFADVRTNPDLWPYLDEPPVRDLLQ